MKIAENTVVKMNYTLFDSEGNKIDSSIGKEPFEYIHGNKMIVPGLEKGLEGKESGEKLTVDVKAQDAYGIYDERLVLDVDKDQFDTDMPIQEGMYFQASSPNGGVMLVKVKKVTDKYVTVDGNHDLAGKDLKFDVEILDVREATEEDLKMLSGCGGGCGGCGGNCDGECDGNCDCENGGCDCK